MERDDVALRPMEYDTERLWQFNHRATYWKNLPKEYKPAYGVDQAAFADAMIGFYIDYLDETYEDDPVSYRVGLARVAFALDFLQGMPPTELTQKFGELEPTEGNVKIAREYALGVAGIGGRHFREQVGVPAAAKPTAKADIKPEIRQETGNEQDYREFANLGSFIRQLYEEKRVSSSEAQALLLLFRQAQSNASREIKSRVIENIAQHLKARLQRCTALQPHKGEVVADETFMKGAIYIRNVVERPGAMLADNRVYVDLVKADMIVDDSLTPQTAYEKIRGHIGYVLDKIY